MNCRSKETSKPLTQERRLPMAKRKVDTKQQESEDKTERLQLGELLSEKAPSQDFIFWIIGDTPIITHAWSEKAKAEMLKKQAGATRTAKEKRDPEQDFLNSLYDMGDGV